MSIKFISFYPKGTMSNTNVLDSFISTAQTVAPDVTIETNALLAPYSTVKIGGPAEMLTTVHTTQELTELCRLAQQQKIPITILGWGANTLIADSGIPGLTILNRTNEIVIEQEPFTFTAKRDESLQRWKDLNHTSQQLFDYYSGDETAVLVRCGSGTPLPFAINMTLAENMTGLEWFSRIPATIGGAIYNNIHGGHHFIGEQVESVTILSESGEERALTGDQLEFGYDTSRFHHTNEIILSVNLVLFRGPVAKARAASTEWAKYKQAQPQKSLGCIFQNLTDSQQQQHNLPTNSVGYLLDKELHLAGYQVGDAKISTNHAAFIENVGNATAADYQAVIEHIQTVVKDKYNIFLKPEIFFRGFPEETVRKLTQA